LLRRQNFKLALFNTLCVACLLFISAVGVLGQTTQSPLPPPTGYVNDYAGVIDAETKKRLETILENLKTRADIEFAVVTVKTTGNTDIFPYTLAVARGWGIGSPEGEKNGLILLVAIDDHKYYTQPSRHLEGDLPDSLLGQIQREKLIPQFKQGNYAQGIYDTVEAYIATLAENRGFSIEGIDQKKAYREPESSDSGSSGSRGGGSSLLHGISPCAIIFVIIIVLLLFSGRGGGGGSGCLNMFLLGSLLNSGRRGGWSSGWGGGGFGGGGSGGFGGGGGGGFGGFGGGGDFGGGGAGGSW
ncbi:MAG TPA: TPM domain-containing protein, partial [Pyrinomonadaceae bacterium]